MTSAPEATEPMTVTSPSGKITDCPERTGSLMTIDCIAGGSVHIYGTLRGRAMAGSIGNASARIFCRKLEAELVAIDGIYKMAEDMAPNLRGQAVQLWLEDDAIMAEKLI
ncbi:septum site-determining protein MinC [Rhizobium leguminosarum]|uniref:septum site-determining protein MinC n=1 Tax=Rhizobium leguminosarum TaxID=384 RepID=UPI003D7C1BB7